MDTKITKLEQIANQLRVDTITKNTYKSGNEYGSTHPNSISNNDEKGKGENNGQVGSLTDINERKSQTTKNRYKSVNEYGLTHKDSISDGDERGKGENNGQVGSSTDITERMTQIAKNKYFSTKTYPDFTI